MSVRENEMQNENEMNKRSMQRKGGGDEGKTKS